jgi:hypothetical protein
VQGSGTSCHIGLSLYSTFSHCVVDPVSGFNATHLPSGSGVNNAVKALSELARFLSSNRYFATSILQVLDKGQIQQKLEDHTARRLTQSHEPMPRGTPPSDFDPREW